jgi:hypothetical protein
MIKLHYITGGFGFNTDGLFALITGGLEALLTDS